jgi:hypothetical protein
VFDPLKLTCPAMLRGSERNVIHPAWHERTGSGRF